MGITGIGIDMVRIQRMEHWLFKPGLLERYFHPQELEASVSNGKKDAHSLAARFAAKEAFGKALGTGLAGITLKDIIVINHANGKPEIEVINTARTALKNSGANRAHLSLTHEHEYAAAVVVLEVL